MSNKVSFLGFGLALTSFLAGCSAASPEPKAPGQDAPNCELDWEPDSWQYKSCHYDKVVAGNKLLTKYARENQQAAAIPNGDQPQGYNPLPVPGAGPVGPFIPPQAGNMPGGWWVVLKATNGQCVAQKQMSRVDDNDTDFLVLARGNFVPLGCDMGHFVWRWVKFRSGRTALVPLLAPQSRGTFVYLVHNGGLGRQEVEYDLFTITGGMSPSIPAETVGYMKKSFPVPWHEDGRMPVQSFAGYYTQYSRTGGGVL